MGILNYTQTFFENQQADAYDQGIASRRFYFFKQRWPSLGIVERWKCYPHVSKEKEAAYTSGYRSLDMLLRQNC